MLKIRILSLIFVCAFVVTAQAPPAQAPAAATPQIVAPAPTPAPQVSAADLALQNAALSEVVDRLARQLHFVLVPPPGGLVGSVTINSYGETRNLDARNLLDMILRINGYGGQQEGDEYRVFKMLDAMHQPIPIQQVAGRDIPDDDQIMLNLIFLKYITVEELEKILKEFIGENAKILTYSPANLLFIMDNRRNMKRIVSLIDQLDGDMFTNQRVRLFQLEHARPSDVQKDLEGVLKAISLDAKTNTVHFLAVDRINMLIAVTPNPTMFETIEEWIGKFDIPATVAAGAVDIYLYTVRYGRNDCLAQALNQLFNPGVGAGGLGGGAGLGGYGVGSPVGAYNSNNYGYGAGGSGAYAGNYGGGGTYGGGSYGSGTGGMGSSYGGSTYGNTNSFSPAFGGSGGCGGAGAAGGSGYGGGYGSYGQPAAFGGYTAQTPLMGGVLVGAGGVPGTATAAGTAAGGTGGAPATPQPVPPRIVPLSFDNKLLIQADPQRYQSILKMLEQLDKPPRQILLDAKILSIDLTDQFSSGVSAYFQNSGVGLPTGISGLAPFASLTSGGVSLSAGMLVSASRQLLGSLSLNENIGHVHILSEPSLIATDSIPATINVGTQVPVLTSQVGTPLQSGGTNAFAQNISGVSTGITLNVNARVNPSGVVTLIIDQENSQPSGGSSSSTTQNLTPSFAQQVVQTQITMQDGDTVAVGGLIGENTTSSVNGIPLLSRLPYIGALFGTKTYSHERTELILFMTPHVIYDTTDLLEASDELIAKVKKLQKYIKGRN
jgi:general secretion pathway protein D